jgi:hypothetical protein
MEWQPDDGASRLSLPDDAIADTAKRLHQINAREVARQPHAAIT